MHGKPVKSKDVVVPPSNGNYDGCIVPPASRNNKAVVLPANEDDCEVCITQPAATNIDDAVVPSPKA